MRDVGRNSGTEESNDSGNLRLHRRDPSSTPHPTELRSATFSDKGEGKKHRAISALPNVIALLFLRLK